MRVLSAHAGADTGGCGWALAGAFRNHPTIELRSAVRASNYIEYPHDLDWSQAGAHARAADVLHLHNTTRTARILGAASTPAVLHHHGTHYRDNVEALNAEVRRRGYRAVVATLDLLEHGDDLTWVPQAFDVPGLAKLRNRVSDGGPLRVGHAPTNRAIKSTDAFLAACEKIPGVEPVLVEQASWADCLAVKATVDVYFDQVQLGYGCNAVEAWAMGIPVICGAAPSTLERMVDQFRDLPFWLATEDTISDAIAAMLDEGTRRDFARLGHQHAVRWHDGRETVARLAPIYESLAA